MALEILDMDASEVPETAASAPGSAPAQASRVEFLRRLERELRLREERLLRRMAD